MTSAPNERYSEANSRPTAPAPITTAEDGMRSRPRAWSLVMTRSPISTPGNSFGEEPVAMTTFGASSFLPSTSTAFGRSSFPVPFTTSILRALTSEVRPADELVHDLALELLDLRPARARRWP